jgi:hypothetical protein
MANVATVAENPSKTGICGRTASSSPIERAVAIVQKALAESRGEAALPTTRSSFSEPLCSLQGGRSPSGFALLAL